MEHRVAFARAEECLDGLSTAARAGKGALDQELGDPDPRPLPSHVVMGKSLTSLGPSHVSHKIPETTLTFQLREHLHDASSLFLTPTSCGEQDTAVGLCGYHFADEVQRFSDLPEFTQTGGDAARIEPRIRSPACLGTPLEYCDVCQTGRAHPGVGRRLMGGPAGRTAAQEGVTLLPAPAPQHPRLRREDSERMCKPREGWSLATQIKIFSHAVGSVQKTFIEALSQTRLSTGGQNK